MTRTDFFHRMVASIVERFTTASPHVLSIAADAAIKGTIVLAIVGLATLAMRRSSAAARHLAWFAGTLSLLLLPVFSLVAPGWHVLPTWTSAAAINIARPLPVERFADTPSQQNPAAIDTQSRQPDAATATSASQFETTTVPATAPALPPAIAPAPSPIVFTWQSVVLLVWLAGSALLLAKVMLGLLSLAWLRHRSSKITSGHLLAAIREIATELGIHRPVELLSSSQRSMPMIWGLWRIRVLLPADAADWSAVQCRVVLLHELAHARRFDCQTQLVAQLARALFWFNPLVWLARWRMQIDREQACDDLVLTSGTKASAYAEQLVRIAAQMPTPHYSAAAIAMARPSTLESRVRAILDETRNRRLAVAAAIAVVTSVGLCTGILAALQAREIRSDPVTTPGKIPITALAPPAGFGRVVDIQNRPIGGAKLSQKQLKWSATCDASGLFRLPKPLSPKQYGQFDLSAAAPGFVSRDYVMFTFVPKGSLLNPNTPDMNPAPKLGDDGIIRLQRLGRVEGTVLGLNGKPLAKAPIELDVRDHFESMTSMIGGAAHAMTDANGRFAMSHVPSGDLLIYYPGWNGRPPVKGVATAVAVNMADGQALRNVVLDLSKSTAIATGQVLDKDGKPVAAANVTLQWRTDTGWSAVASMFQAKSDNDGRYRLEKLPQGNWAISATIGHTYGEPVAVVLSGDKPAHLDLVLPVVHALSGRIRRVQPMNPSDTVQEWIDATLAGDRDGASAVVAPGSPFDRNAGRLRPLLKQITRFTSSSGYGQSPRGDAITNTLDFGGGRQGTIKFKMIRQGEAWLIDDAVDENDKSLVGERSE